MYRGQPRKLAQILPATALSDESSSAESIASGPSGAVKRVKAAKAPAKPRRFVTDVACNNCRRRKAKVNDDELGFHSPSRGIQGLTNAVLRLVQQCPPRLWALSEETGRVHL